MRPKNETNNERKSWWYIEYRKELELSLSAYCVICWRIKFRGAHIKLSLKLCDCTALWHEEHSHNIYLKTRFQCWYFCLIDAIHIRFRTAVSPQCSFKLHKSVLRLLNQHLHYSIPSFPKSVGFTNPKRNWRQLISSSPDPGPQSIQRTLNPRSSVGVTKTDAAVTYIVNWEQHHAHYRVVLSCHSTVTIITDILDRSSRGYLLSSAVIYW